jgi:ubiquinone/menaquinone biosynthesis C-methylase UbiE
MSNRINGNYYSANFRKHTYDNALHQWHLKVFMNRLNEMVRLASPRSVLDAGCGEGFVLSFLKSENPRLDLTGTDLSHSAIEYARKHFSEVGDFRQGNIYELPFEDDSFDLVICSEVLEHLDAPEKAIRELKRVSRQHVLITVPLEPYFQWLNNIGRLVGIGDDIGHVNFWNRERFHSLMDEHFDIVETHWHQIYQLGLGRVA